MDVASLSTSAAASPCDVQARPVSVKPLPVVSVILYQRLVRSGRLVIVFVLPFVRVNGEPTADASVSQSDELMVELSPLVPVHW